MGLGPAAWAEKCRNSRSRHLAGCYEGILPALCWGREVPIATARKAPLLGFRVQGDACKEHGRSTARAVASSVRA